MTNERIGRVPVGHGDRWPRALASLTVGTAFFSLWFWLLPQWLGFRLHRLEQRIGDGWRWFRRCWDPLLRCAASGT
jgi:hypothetical protein